MPLEPRALKVGVFGNLAPVVTGLRKHVLILAGDRRFKALASSIVPGIVLLQSSELRAHDGLPWHALLALEFVVLSFCVFEKERLFVVSNLELCDNGLAEAGQSDQHADCPHVLVLHVPQGKSVLDQLAEGLLERPFGGSFDDVAHVVAEGDLRRGKRSDDSGGNEEKGCGMIDEGDNNSFFFLFPLPFTLMAWVIYLSYVYYI